MNISRYISGRLNSVKTGSFTASVTKIAIISIALGLAIMIVSFAILEGFRNQIQDKIFSFGAHLQVTKFDTNNSFEGAPISANTPIKELAPQQIRHVQTFARKTAIIKAEDEVMGVVLKGVSPDYDLEPMQENLVAGSVISFTDTAASLDIMISKRTADKLKLEVNDEAVFYFIQYPPRARKLKIKGIFNTGLEEFDEIFVIGDLALVRQLNSWPDTLVGGYEIFLHDFKQVDQVAEKMYNELSYDLILMKITDQYAQLFEWLGLLKRNVVIFLALIFVVAAFNMVSTVFIMILERTNMIGILKAVGATNRQISKIFVYNGLRLTLKGLLWGNIIGIGFCVLQYYFEFIPLDPENYYMDTVPIHWNFYMILLLNVLTLGFTMMSILIPSILIARIKPVNAIKFD